MLTLLTVTYPLHLSNLSELRDKKFLFYSRAEFGELLEQIALPEYHHIDHLT